MNSRLILWISGNGDFEILLSGKGQLRRKLFKAFEVSVEPLLPIMKQKVKSVLMRGDRNENTDPNIN